MKLKSITGKIALVTLVCILTVGIVCYSFLYSHLTSLVADKAAQVEQVSLEELRKRLNLGIDQFQTLCGIAAGDFEISRAAMHTDHDSIKARRELVNAHEKLTQYLSTSSVKPHVSKFLVFNHSGVTAQAATNFYSLFSDYSRVMALELFTEFEASGKNHLIAVSPSIAHGDEGRPCVAYLGWVQHLGAPGGGAWLYAELSPTFFEEAFLPYTGSNVFVTSAQQARPLAASKTVPEELLALWPASLENGTRVEADGGIYQVRALPLALEGLEVYSLLDVTLFASDRVQVLVTVLVVAITSVLAVLLLAFSVTFFINRPLKRLTARLRRISDNDFSYDAEIEKGSDEIAEVGKVVNEMTISIGHLLKETEEMYELKKDTEIALLQSQINPHFLYNTLDSIHWMAVIQNNPGVAKTVRSLSNLLRNMAKGVGDRITLSEESSLLMDYVDTQRVRFMEMFELDNRIPEIFSGCRIIKFTLQPLVENAIFHGIEPSGRLGVITLNAREEDGFLYITVEDNGVGMDAEELEALKQADVNPNPGGMAGIGLANVNNRLRLHYGRDCGLHYESVKGQYTRVSVRIPMEE